MAYPVLIGRMKVGSWDLTVGGSARATTAGSYWFAPYSGEGSTFLDHLQTVIRNDYGSATVTLSMSTGLVTIDLATTGTIVWDDTELRDLLGFTGNLSGASSYTGTYQPYYMWRPSRATGQKYPHYFTDDEQGFWIPNSQTLINRSENGTVYTLQGQTTYSSQLSFEYLPAADVISPSTGRDYSFQKFWTDVCAAGQPFRVVFDRSNYVASAYAQAVIAPSDGEYLGDFSSFSSRNIETFNDFWSVNVPLLKWVQ